MQARMLPVAAVFDAFPRLVRDLARDSGKEIALQLLGADTELDRKVLEAIKDPLIHLLRNAVDHGIEPPDARERAGKPRQGTIAVRAFQKGNRILVEVADDGAGINRDRVRQAALKAGLIGADEAETLADERVLRLIFEAGLSTSPIVTGLSGRGVGMGVVRQNVEALHGQAAVDSTPGRGTTITLALPLTMATMQQVLVQAGDQTYGIPVSAVERIQRIDPKDIGRVAGRQAIAFNGEPIALARLADVLEQPAAGQPDEIDASPRVLAVILNALGQRAAFQVDAVLGQQEMVVNSLGRQLARVRNVAGATILGSGQVVLILNPADLLKSVWAMPDRPDTTPPPARRPDRRSRQATILVVDDSLSLRTLERNILEAAGYTVMVAGDGLEALRLLNSKSRCDLIVSDVMMPHMTGLELTAAVRQQPALKHIPVVLVTSLGSREDMERGIEVGADAYLVKDSFEQSDLLGTIEQLI
jgi:two-component system chemotaxis sensor kinase CheA